MSATQEEPALKSLSDLVALIRAERPNDDVPDFDNANGNANARFLFLLEAPGPRARIGMVSLENEDPTARNLKAQLAQARIPITDIVLWNIVPWFLGDKGKFEKTVIRAATQKDISLSLPYLDMLLFLLPKLECIVLVGGAARKAHAHLSKTTAARILTCHHTSQRVAIQSSNKMNENIEILKFMLQSSLK